MRRLLALALLFSAAVSAQMPKGIYAWWSRPQIARDLNLSPSQREQIRATVQQYRPHLLNVRVAVNQAEQALADQFNRNPVDPAKTNEAIEAMLKLNAINHNHQCQIPIRDFRGVDMSQQRP